MIVNSSPGTLGEENEDQLVLARVLSIGHHRCVRPQSRIAVALHSKEFAADWNYRKKEQVLNAATFWNLDCKQLVFVH